MRALVLGIFIFSFSTFSFGSEVFKGTSEIPLSDSLEYIKEVAKRSCKEMGFSVYGAKPLWSSQDENGQTNFLVGKFECLVSDNRSPSHLNYIITADDKGYTFVINNTLPQRWIIK